MILDDMLACGKASKLRGFELPKDIIFETEVILVLWAHLVSFAFMFATFETKMLFAYLLPFSPVFTDEALTSTVRKVLSFLPACALIDTEVMIVSQAYLSKLMMVTACQYLP